MTRREWQVLASLARGPAGRDRLTAALAAFDPPEVLTEVAQGLEQQGLVVERDGVLQLTEGGHRTQTALAPAVDEVRALVTGALPGEDYRTLVGLLERLVRALADER